MHMGGYVMHPSFLGYGVPNDYILEALAHLYNNNHGNVSKSPPKLRHDGTSPLPLGMDWSPPPSNWEGRDTVWPHEPRTGWSYCVDIPSWTFLSNSGASGSVVLKKIFPKKNMPVPPSKMLLVTKNKSLTEERRSSLEHWMEKLLSDIDSSRCAPVAIFLELEAAVRSSFNELSGEETASFVEYQPLSDASGIADSSSVV